MSLITDDPDHSPRDCSTKRHRHHHHHACQSRGRRRALIAASSALASLLSLAIILWLTLRPSTPRFSLLAAAATATDLALPNATVVVDAAFTAHNPNARAAALYDRLQARASYAGLQLTATAPLPPFDQPQGDVVLSASLSSSPVAAAVTAGGRGLLRLRIEGQLRWKVAAWVSGRHALSVDCVAVVLLQPSPSPSQLRAVVLQGSQWVPEMSARLLVALQRLRLRPYIYMRTREGRKDMHRSTCTVHLIDRIRNGIGMSRVEALSLSGMSAIPAEYVRPEEERRDLGDAFDLAWTPGAPLIPVVDIAAFDTSESDSEASRACVEAVRAAATEWGVMHIAGHGIPPELMDQLRTAGTDFFALPIQEKEAYANDPAAGRLQGYGSRLATNASGQREWEDYLFHLIHPDHRADHALWPASPPEYVPVTRRFGHLVRSLASKLLAVLSLGLGLPHPTLEQRLVGEEEDLLLKLKINYYPKCPQPDLAVGVEAHTDVSALSFILHNGVPGLQVHHAGRWVTARSEPGTIVVHVGDALEILSNGRYTSVLHRGLVTRKAVRVSWVVFCEPPPDAVLLQPLPELLTDAEPARFTPRTFKQHLERKVLKKHKDEEEQRSTSPSPNQCCKEKGSAIVN